MVKFKLGLLGCKTGQHARMLVPKTARSPEMLRTSETFEEAFEHPHAVELRGQAIPPSTEGHGDPQKTRGLHKDGTDHRHSVENILCFAGTLCDSLNLK